MCSIGTICEQFGLTPRAIRFYEEKGLIASTRGPLNHRRYGAEARARLARIASFRRAGLSLEDIGEIFAADTAEAEGDRLFEKLKRRMAEIEADRRQVERLLQDLGADRRAA